MMVAGRVNLALRGLHNTLRVAGHWRLFRPCITVLRSYCILRCLEARFTRRLWRGRWRWPRIRVRPRPSLGLFFFPRVFFFPRGFLFLRVFFFPSPRFAMYDANRSQRLARRSWQVLVFRECSAEEGFANRREEKSLSVIPRYNCVLS